VAKTMWSLTSPRAERISGPEKFRSSAEKDFFNTIGPGTDISSFLLNVSAIVLNWLQPELARGRVGLPGLMFDA
jgi:hypothetical protein